MGIKDILSRVGALIASRNVKEGKDVPDDETRDKYLRSLRRQKRIMEEKIEKKRLIKEITEDNRIDNTKMLMTDDDQNITKMRYTPEKYSFLQPVKKERVRILSSKIKNLKKKKQSGFLGKGSL